MSDRYLNFKIEKILDNFPYGEVVAPYGKLSSIFSILKLR